MADSQRPSTPLGASTTDGCMVLDLRADPLVIGQPLSRFSSATEYRCRRCGESFSSPHLSREGDTCPFDETAVDA